MEKVTLILEPEVVLFYTRAAQILGLKPEQVMQDALFKLAGELSLESLRKMG